MSESHPVFTDGELVRICAYMNQVYGYGWKVEGSTVYDMKDPIGYFPRVVSLRELEAAWADLSS